MKKIVYTLVILIAVSCVQYASACPQAEGSMTGGACSIKELKNLEKSKTLQEPNLINLEKGLRPVRVSPEKKKPGCDVFGLCLRERLTK